MPAAKSKPESIKVVARCRPLSHSEVTEGRTPTVTVVPPDTIQIESGAAFKLDHVFGTSSNQADVFDSVAKPVVDQVLEGFNATIFAYGQTGSGKTFTMEGSEELPGIMPRTFEYLAERIAAASGTYDYVVYLSFLEIYNDSVTDLLVKRKGQAPKLEVKESKERGVFVDGLGQHVVQGVQDMMRNLQLGKRNRKVGETKMNQESSRSHSILTLTVVRVEGPEGSAAAAAVAPAAKGAKAAKAVGKVSVGKLHLVDLAGSERASKTGAAGDRLKEGIAINKSLSALGNVMNALCDGKTGALVPYRDSKLTRLLQDSLGGNSKTVMVANIGPADYNSDETLSTLKYAARARNISNTPKVNSSDDPSDAVVQQYKQQVEQLRAEFQEKLAKIEEAHTKELEQLKQELQAKATQAAQAAQAEEAAKVAALQQRLAELEQEKVRRQQQEQQVEALQKQLQELQIQAEQQQPQQQPAAAVASSQAAGAKEPGGSPSQAASQRGTDSPKKHTSSGRYQKEIAELKDRIRQMQKDAISDYSHILEQSDELARLRAKALEEAGHRVQADEALKSLQEHLEGVQGLSADQAAELKRMQALVLSLQARSIRSRAPQPQLDDAQKQHSAGGARSLREDLGSNLLFEELVVDMGYDAEAARQAIVAMPWATTDEIVDYILDKEAVFQAWRRFKSALTG